MARYHSQVLPFRYDTGDPPIESGLLSMGANSSIMWDIRLAGWIIQDGTYPDFEVGQTAEFALEFCVPRGVAARASGGKVSANNLGRGMYETIAEVIVQAAQITVLDIGVLVYEHTSFLQPPLPQGPRLAVQLSLGVDPFSCFETLNQTGEVCRSSILGKSCRSSGKLRHLWT
jgi:hypothetical protein